MADVKLSDGREVEFDLDKITISEYRSLFDITQADDEADKVYAKCCNLPAKEIGALSFPDFRRLTKGFFEKSREPLADPS